MNEKYNLPALLAGEAGDALSRLLGSLLDVATAYVRRGEARVEDATERARLLREVSRDRTQARALIEEELALRASKITAENPEAVDAFIEAVAPEYKTRATNRLQVGLQAVEYIQEEAGPADESEAQAASQEDQEAVSNDFIDYFSRFAETASSAEMQDRMARVLAGEIHRPGAISRQTISFMAEVSTEIAQTFKDWEPAFFMNRLSTGNDEDITPLMNLQDAGLVGGVGGFTSQQFFISPNGTTIIKHKGHLFGFEGTPGEKLSFGGCYLTKVGREVQTLLDPSGWRDGVLRAIKHMEKAHLKRVYHGAVINAVNTQAVIPIEVLWNSEAT